MCQRFLWISVGKKNTHLAKVCFEFLFLMLWLYTGTGFLMVLHKLTCEPWNTTNKYRAAVEGAALKLLPGLTRPGPCDPRVLYIKTSSLPTLFCCIYFPKVYLIVTIFLICIYKHTFWHVLSYLPCMVVIYFFVCGRKHELKLPTNILTRVWKETQSLR